MFYNEINFNEETIREQFKTAMKQAGVIPKSDNMILEIDGQLHRFQTQDDKGGNVSGCYKLYDSGQLPAGYFQDWRKNIKRNWHFDTTGMPKTYKLSKEEYIKQKREQEEAHRKVQKLQAEKYQEAIRKAHQVYIKTPAMTDKTESHYLKTKGRNVYNLLEYQPEKLKPHEYHDNIIFPLVNSQTMQFQGYQRMFIDETGTPCKAR